MHKRSFYIINSITVYRLAVSPLLIFLAIAHREDLFKWLLPISFFTDAIDGFLSRRYKVTSIFGSRLDSIADDLTITAAIIGILLLKPGFVSQQLLLISVLLGLFILQTVLALVRYKKISSFHTYLAKIAAVMQGTFLVLMFFLAKPPLLLFYIAAVITILDLIEEILLVFVLPHWETNVKGLYWVIKKAKATRA